MWAEVFPRWKDVSEPGSISCLQRNVWIPNPSSYCVTSGIVLKIARYEV